MQEDEILSILSSCPRSVQSGQKVALELLKKIESLGEIESKVIEYVNRGLDISEIRDTIWNKLDSRKLNLIETARLRLCICVLTGLDKFDDMSAEMLYYCCEKIGMKSDEVSKIIELEINSELR